MSSPSRVLLVGPTPELSFAAQDLELLAAGHEPEAVWRRDFPTRSEIVAAVRSRLATREFSLLLVWFAEPYDSANLLLLSRRLRVPSLLVVGGYEVTHLPELGYGSLGRLRDRLRVRLALQLASVVLPTSSLLAKEVTALGRKRGVIVVPPGIDVSLFRPGTAPKEPLVVTVATVSEKTVRLKGLDVFARVSAQVPEASFVVLGPSEDDAVVERLLGLGGTNLAIPGHRLSATELRDWYRRAAVYAQLSIRESFGVALAEAMACECRPVFTRRGALEEVAGPIGHAVGYGDVVSAAAAIRQAVRAAACPEARQRIATLYSRERRQHSLLRITSDLQRQA